MKFHIGLRRGLITAVAILLGATILIITLISGLLLERIYVMQVQTRLIEAFTTISQEGYQDYDILYQIENSNINIYVVDPGYRALLYMSKTFDPDPQHLVRRIIDDVEYGLDEAGEELFFIYSRDETQQSSSGASVYIGRRVTIGGQLETGEYILMDTSYEPIADTANLSLRFTLISGLAVLIIALLFVAYITPRVTDPIEQIKESARSISNKDFSVRCGPSAIDEIYYLGDSINRMSDEMQKYLTELEDANEKLKRDIVEKERRDISRKNLISNISHDLKTPLAIISGYTEGLKSGMADTPEKTQEYCDIISDESDRMLSLILKLLEISRLESGVAEIDLEDFDVTEILDYLVNTFSLAADQQGVTMDKEYDAGIYVLSDYLCIEQVLTNYVQNALQHGNGRNIIIGIRDLGERVEIYVYNEGNNIPQDELTRIWESFYKADKSRTRSHSESGLGLAIVSGNMQLLGMPYGVRNTQGGVEFWIHLPKAAGIEPV